jgi:hypothetical protein
MVNNVTSMPEQGTSQKSLLAYPNPLVGSTTIVYELESAGRVSFTVLDSRGAEVMAVPGSNHDKGVHEISLDCSQLKLGIYILQMEVISGSNRQVRVLKLKHN